ncbi:hypothetical protein FNF31_05312 [Cafeteria roenbergensis]|uniref:CNNM transmembrane domain-containing protein n=2 Tax=Cafeteria roenbergensis TaxID=33653 RepID=A0A5A8D0E1_CAFRO|nr:hypothetical protein FNF31_05312 [Cafeteria roenbergensis]
MAGMECADLPAVMSDDSIRWCGRLWVAAGGVAASAAQPLGESEPLEPGTAAFYTNLGISVALIITAGLMAGLTMGVVSMDATYVEILARTGTKAQKRQAKALAPFVKRHHLTLVTLLLANASANEMLPIFLDSLLDPIMAIVLSVTAVLIFGEILPSAVFTGPNQMRIAAAMTPLLWFIVVIFYPIAFPISWILDKCLGEDHGTRYRRDELKEFIRLHGSAKRVAKRIHAKAHDAAAGGSATGPLLEGGPDLHDESGGGGYGSGGATESLAAGVGSGDLSLTVRHSHSFKTRKADGTAVSQHKAEERVQAAVTDVSAKAASVVDTCDVAGMLVIAKTTSGRPQADDAHRGSTAGLRVMAETAVPGRPSAATPRADEAGGQSAAAEGEHFVESHALLRDEVTMLEGVLELSKKCVADVATPAEEVFALSTDDKMDRATMTRVIESGFSRVPVYSGSDRGALRGFFLVKLLIRLDPDDATPVSSLTLMPALAIHPEVSLFDALNAFQTGKAHLAFVSEQDEALATALEAGVAPPAGVAVAGLITIEDVLEEILKEEIEDEVDVLCSTGAIQRFRSRHTGRKGADHGPRAAAAASSAAASGASGDAVRVPNRQAAARAKDHAKRQHTAAAGKAGAAAGSSRGARAEHEPRQAAESGNAAAPLLEP